MENILINFSADPSGLQPGIDALAELEIAEKSVIDEVKKMNAEMEKASKKTDESISENIGSIDELNKAFKNLSKSVLGQTYSQVFTDLQNGLRLSRDEMESFYKLLIKNSRTELLSAQSVEEIEALQGLIDTATEALAGFEKEGKDTGKVVQNIGKQAAEAEKQMDDLSDTIDDAGKGTKELGDNTDDSADKMLTLQQQLKAVKTELGLMAAAGKEGTEEFAVLTAQAGDLTDRINSVNKQIKTLSSSNIGLDAMIEGVQGLVGGFAAAQGVVGLFATENEELERALLKVNSALAILQGVQSVMNTLKKESAVTTAAEIALKRVDILQTNLQAAAESRNVVVKYASIAATKALNVVMAMNPAGVLLLAIGALAGALVYFTATEEDATEATKAYNEALLDQLEIEKQLQEATEERIRSQRRGLENQLAYAKSAGKSTSEIKKLELELADVRALEAQRRIKQYEDEIMNLDKYQAAYEDALLKVRAFDQQLMTNPDMAEDEDFGKRMEIARQEVQIAKTKYENLKQIDDEYRNSQRDRNQAILDFEKFTQEQALKSAVAYADARVILAQKNSAEEFRARRAALSASLRQELADVNLTEGEKAKIRAKYRDDIATVNREEYTLSLQNAKAAIDKQTLLAKEKTKERLDFEIESLNIARQIELQQVGLTKQQVALINEQYRQQELEKIRSFNRQVAEDTINARVADINSQIAQQQVDSVDQTNRQLIKLKQDLIDEQARLEAVGVEFSEKNEELRRIKIKAIYDRALLDKKELERQKQEAEISSDQQYFQALYELEARKAEIILERERSTNAQRKKAQQDLYIFQRAQIQNDEAALKERYAKGLITEEQYQTQLLGIKLRYMNQELTEFQAAEMKKQMIRDYTIQAIQSLSTVFFQQNARSYNEEAQQAEDLKDKKLITEQEYNERMKAIRRKQDQDAKAQAIFQMLISQGPAALKGFQQGGWVGAAAAIAFFAGLLATVSGASAPGYKHGVIGIDGPGTGTSDSIPARLSKGESVITAAATKKWGDALKAINEDKFEKYIMRLPRPATNIGADIAEHARMSRLSPMVYQAAKETRIENSLEIDYQKMAEAFAEKLAENPTTNINLDESGFNVSVHKGMDQIDYVNKKMNL